jgi:hypothetical protein
MMSSEILVRARAAVKTTTIDGMLGIHTELLKVSISPLAVTGRDPLATKEQWLLSKMPDLLDLAVYTWYALQKEGE